MPAGTINYSHLTDTERELLTKLDQILGAVQELQARQREAEERLKGLAQRAREAKQHL